MTVPVMKVDKTGTLADALGLSLMPAANTISALTTSVPAKTIPARINATILSPVRCPRRQVSTPLCVYSIVGGVLAIPSERARGRCHEAL